MLRRRWVVALGRRLRLRWRGIVLCLAGRRLLLRRWRVVASGCWRARGWRRRVELSSVRGGRGRSGRRRVLSLLLRWWRRSVGWYTVSIGLQYHGVAAYKAVGPRLAELLEELLELSAAAKAGRVCLQLTGVMLLRHCAMESPNARLYVATLEEEDARVQQGRSRFGEAEVEETKIPKVGCPAQPRCPAFEKSRLQFRVTAVSV